jgi:hypothetical protein
MFKDFQSENFLKWFGNSKIVNKDKSPRIMYHTTQTSIEFNTFKQVVDSEFGYHFGTLIQAHCRAEPTYNKDGTFYFNDTRIYPVFLRIEKPLLVSDIQTFNTQEVTYELKRLFYEMENNDSENFIEEEFELCLSLNRTRIVEEYKSGVVHPTYEIIKTFLYNKGYDGFKYKNECEGQQKHYSYVVFFPWQIKSAIGNNGNFDINNDNILK